MIEMVKNTEHASGMYAEDILTANDNRRGALSLGRSLFPEDAVARIYKPSRSVMTSGKAGTKPWRLVFERRTAPFIEPLMGWTGGDDTLVQVELQFKTLEAAVRYAERQGLLYAVEPAGELELQTASSARAFTDATLLKLGLNDLRQSYGRAIEAAANCNDPSHPQAWTSPMAVVRDRRLSLDAKRSILIDWAWIEHLNDRATNGDRSANGRPSLLDEIEQALLTLEHGVAGSRTPSPSRKAA